MTVITTRLIVQPDGTLSLVDPMPAGEYVAQITIDDLAVQPSTYRSLTPADFPVHDLGPWPTGATFGRDEIYDDDGR